MDELSWVEKRLSVAVQNTQSEKHKFSNELQYLLSNLLSKHLHDSKKTSEIEEIANSLIRANRGNK